MKKIIIVDDEPNIVMTLEYTFKKHNFEIALTNIPTVPQRPQYQYDLSAFNDNCKGELTVKISLLKDENMITYCNPERLMASDRKEMLNSSEGVGEYYCFMASAFTRQRSVDCHFQLSAHFSDLGVCCRSEAQL